MAALKNRLHIIQKKEEWERKEITVFPIYQKLNPLSKEIAEVKWVFFKVLRYRILVIQNKPKYMKIWLIKIMHLLQEALYKELKEGKKWMRLKVKIKKNSCSWKGSCRRRNVRSMLWMENGVHLRYLLLIWHKGIRTSGMDKARLDLRRKNQLLVIGHKSKNWKKDTRLSIILKVSRLTVLWTPWLLPLLIAWCWPQMDVFSAGALSFQL